MLPMLVRVIWSVCGLTRAIRGVDPNGGPYFIKVVFFIALLVGSFLQTAMLIDASFANVSQAVSLISNVRPGISFICVKTSVKQLE